MCGIVGIFAKSPEIEQTLGVHLAAMLTQLSDRGPDSAGIAVYREPAGSGAAKLTLFSPDPLENWDVLKGSLASVFGSCAERSIRASHAVVTVQAEASDVEEWVREHRPDLRVMSAGQAIEIYKETGSPAEFAERFHLNDIQASHGLGHT